MPYTMQEILRFKYPDAFVGFSPQIRIQDDGAGPYISSWTVPGVPKPTLLEIQAYASDPAFIENRALFYRENDPVNGYKSNREMLLMMYNDLKNGTQTLQQHIGTVNEVIYPTTGIAGSVPDVTPIVVAKRNTTLASIKELAIVYASSTQNISGINKTTLVLDTEIIDANNKFASNTYTALTGGIYEITGFVQVTNLAIISLVSAYTWQLFVTQSGSVNKSTLIDVYTHGILGAIDSAVRGTTMIKLAANDTVVLQVQKSASSGLIASNAQINIKKICDV